MTSEAGDSLPDYRFADEAGPGEPLPDELDTVEGGRARARLVRPEAEPKGRVAREGHWIPVFHRQDTVPIETDADLDATSAYPRAS
ncbi:MAG: hypothetical protein ABEJ96_08450, partial [Thiohalorhabdaceae bacterium]